MTEADIKIDIDISETLKKLDAAIEKLDILADKLEHIENLSSNITIEGDWINEDIDYEKEFFRIKWMC
jgi:hypothetical protein